MEVGRWNKLPHYAVHGTKTDFYVWINEDGKGSGSKWIKGREAFDLWGKFSKLSTKDKNGFIALVKSTHVKHS